MSCGSGSVRMRVSPLRIACDREVDVFKGSASFRHLDVVRKALQSRPHYVHHTNARTWHRRFTGGQPVAGVSSRQRPHRLEKMIRHGRFLICPREAGAEELVVATVFSDCPGEVSVALLLPLLSLLESFVASHAHKLPKVGKVVVEHQVVRMAYAAERHKEHTRLLSCLPQVHHRASQRHALRFPWSNRPGEDEGNLRARNVTLHVVRNRPWQNRHPGAASVFREERRPFIERKINDDALRHAAGAALVVRVRVIQEHDVHDDALSSVEEAGRHV